MGMFDYVRCKYPLPAGAPVEGYQTKDTDAQYLDLYEIREDGTLWHEDVTHEWVDDPGCPIFNGYLKRVSEEWKPVPMTGEVAFYTDGWEFSAYFVRGQLKHLEVIKQPLPTDGSDGR